MLDAAATCLRLIVGFATASLLASAAKSQEWPVYGGAEGGGQYSGANLISKTNVTKLRQEWITHTGELADGWARSEKLTFEANPILAEGRLYLSTATGVVLALDPTDGKVLWRTDAHVDGQTRFGELASRGVTSWLDPIAAPGSPCRHRIFLGTIDARLLAYDGENGAPCTGFGNHGAVNLRQGIHVRDAGDYVVTSPPAVVGNVVIVGSAIGDNRAAQVEEGIVRAFDARSGRPLWSWDPIPRTGNGSIVQEFDRPPGTAVQQTGAANVWAPMAVDAKRGWVFLPTSSPSPDFFGGQRNGANRDANSVVAVEALTGRVLWRRQLVHHDLWDYDLASQPVLATIEVAGRPRDVLIQGTKMGFVFVLDRDNGNFVFPVQERPVPASDIPGEKAWPTQPFPDSWLQLADTAAVTADGAWGFTPLDRLACRRKIEGLRSAGVYTPPSAQGTIMFPGYAGGINWAGLTFDPARKILLAPVLQLAMVVTLSERRPNEPTPTSAEREAHPNSEFAQMAGTPYVLRREPLLSPIGAP